MSELSELPRGHLLLFLSPPNQQRLASYLSLLQARQYAPSTLGSIAGSLKSFCRLLPDSRRTRIIHDFAATTPEDVDAYLQAACEHGLAPSTISGHLVALRCFFTFLLEEGDLSRQPVRRHRHDILVPQTLPRPMANEDVVTFFQVIDSLRDRVIFLFMLRSGLRVSEVCRLRWSAVNGEQSSVRIDNSKGAVDRVVYMSADLEKALGQWRTIEPPEADYLFASRLGRKAGHPVGRRLIQHLMTRYVEQAQLSRPYTCHSLRHTFATDLLNAGASLEVVKELMGHQKLDMTLRYAKLYEATKRQQYDQAMAHVERRQNLLGGTP